MKLFYHNDTGILLYSEENFFNYNISDPSQWYNITFTRELKEFKIIDTSPTNGGNNGEPPADLSFILLIIFSGIGIAVGLTLAVRYIRSREPRDKAPKKPLKHNPKLERKK